jgi:RNA polymerase sigma-70 factor (ECF subfamily)
MSDSADVEARAQNACKNGDYATAATLILESYGGEIMAFLVVRLRNRSDAEEVFGIFAEKLWVGLPQFEWRCTARGWAYRLARNAANDFADAAHNRPGRHVALSQHKAFAELVERVRTTTAVYRQTTVKDRMRVLRERLPPDDQLLLILRVDRRMEFRDLAAAMGEENAALDAEQLDRDAARLRKQFERIKERLRAMAKEEGLL